MSGSGGRGFRNRSSDEIRRCIDQVQNEGVSAAHDNRVNAELGDLLAQYNGRDVDLIGERLQQIRESLEDSLESTVDLRFGGSIAKHTFVDGMSDVDALVVLQASDLAGLSAAEVLENFRETLLQELSYVVDVRTGQLATTVTFPDGMEIQLLPAVRTGDGFRIPAASSDGWSSIVRPDAFASKLTESKWAAAHSSSQTCKSGI